MPMPEQHQRRFHDFLKTKGVIRPDNTVNVTCAACGSRTWSLSVIEGVAAAAMICDNCGYAMLFDPVRTGLNHP